MNNLCALSFHMFEAAVWLMMRSLSNVTGRVCDWFSQYCISCRRCSHLYIGETGRSLRSRFGEHLRSIRKNTPGFPVAQHFNSTGHSITDVQVRGMRLCSGTKIQRKQQEMRLIFRLGTVQPHGLNITSATFKQCTRNFSTCAHPSNIVTNLLRILTVF